VLKVHDFLFRGGPEYFYRLTAGTGPHIDFIFPPAGIPGSRSQFVIYGRNLPTGAMATEFKIDGKPLEQLPVEIELPTEPAGRQRLSVSTVVRPADVVNDGIEYRLNGPQGVSNPVLLSFATAPVVVEQEPN